VSVSCPVAELSGLDLPVGERACQEARNRGASWRQSSYDHLEVVAEDVESEPQRAITMRHQLDRACGMSYPTLSAFASCSVAGDGVMPKVTDSVRFRRR